MSVKAVIFDMDGLMFDTEQLSMDILKRSGKECGYDIPDELFMQVIGLNHITAHGLFTKYLGEAYHTSNVGPLHRKYMNEHIEKIGLPIKTGLLELLDFLTENKIKKAVATSTPRERATFYLQSVHIDKMFDAIICGDMITHGKPDPDIFLKASELLETPPAECLVLEDSIHGILAAHRANIRPVFIPDLVPANEETEKIIYRKYDTLLGVIDLIKEGV